MESVKTHTGYDKQQYRIELLFPLTEIRPKFLLGDWIILA